MYVVILRQGTGKDMIGLKGGEIPFVLRRDMQEVFPDFGAASP